MKCGCRQRQFWDKIQSSRLKPASPPPFGANITTTADNPTMNLVKHVVGKIMRAPATLIKLIRNPGARRALVQRILKQQGEV